MAEPIIYAILGGILPAIVWLIFWLREDRKNPEPDGLIAKTFLFGMIAVFLVLPVQRLIELNFVGITFSALVLWAMVEEIFKYLAGYFGGLHTVEDNEPIDPLIYMVTAALGFVAVENTLFILGPLLDNDNFLGLVTGNFRFIGASLLHIVSSGIVGSSLAFNFYKPRHERTLHLAFALIFAVLFHTAFNWAIVIWDNTGVIFSLLGVWAGVVILLLAFEKAKTIAPNT